MTLSLSMNLACSRTGFDVTPLWARLPYGLVIEWQGAARQYTITSTGLDSALSRKRREAPKC
jgi:hypothetical protein